MIKLGTLMTQMWCVVNVAFLVQSTLSAARHTVGTPAQSGWSMVIARGERKGYLIVRTTAGELTVTIPKMLVWFVTSECAQTTLHDGHILLDIRAY